MVADASLPVETLLAAEFGRKTDVSHVLFGHAMGERLFFREGDIVNYSNHSSQTMSYSGFSGSMPDGGPSKENQRTWGGPCHLMARAVPGKAMKDRLHQTSDWDSICGNEHRPNRAVRPRRENEVSGMFFCPTH